MEGFKPQNQTIPPTPRSDEARAQTSVARKLAQDFESAGINVQLVETEEAGKFTEAIVFLKAEKPKEKMVRLFRGVNDVDENMLVQEPYAIRHMDYSGKKPRVIVLEELRAEVEKLAQEPTYEHLADYVEKARPLLSERENDLIDYDLAQIEKALRDGDTLRNTLAAMQHRRNGGVPDVGLMPFVSVSGKAHEALGYARSGGILVIDIPISKIEDGGYGKAHDGETRIRGSFDLRDITAFIPAPRVRYEDREQEQKDLSAILEKVSEAADMPIFTNEEGMRLREEQSTAALAEDQRQLPIDLTFMERKKVEWTAASRQKALAVLEKFPEVNVNLERIERTENTLAWDVYKRVRYAIYDEYHYRRRKIPGEPERSPFGFDASEEGLLRLREYVKNKNP